MRFGLRNWHRNVSPNSTTTDAPSRSLDVGNTEHSTKPQWASGSAATQRVQLPPVLDFDTP
jgi:hypothetical protein